MEFHINDIILCDWQYTTKHLNPNDFTIGEKVFLVSNPETHLTVHSINPKTITVSYLSIDGQIKYCDLQPQCLLQYEYRGLITYKGKYNLSLN